MLSNDNTARDWEACTIAKAFVYCRVSTDRQAADGVSLDAQPAKAGAWCELNGYEMAEVFVDSGISCKLQDNRPELHRALDAVLGLTLRAIAAEFLNEFRVNGPRRTAFISGESGQLPCFPAVFRVEYRYIGSCLFYGMARIELNWRRNPNAKGVTWCSGLW